jgi:hypothetical protein
MKRNSTSRYNLNADFGLSFLGMVKWMLFNYLNNRGGNELIDSRVKISKFRVSNFDNWNQVDLMASPSRRLCDFFWLNLKWDTIISDLGAPLNAIEIGCGSGVYGRLIENHIGNNLCFYRGIDINEHNDWAELRKNPKFQFIQSNAASVENDLVGTNFIFTQSGLEHFEEDLTFFKQVANYVENVDHPIIQIHLVPSRACISTYPWHGFRQYTNASISEVTQLFSNNSEFEWISLGGEACNRVHRKFITFPIYTKRGDLRRKFNKQYNEELKKAITMDNESKSEIVSSFAVLIIRSNFKKLRQ